MRITALILGILGGLSGLSFAAYAVVALWIFSAVGMDQGSVALAKLLIWGLPVLAFVGAGFSMTQPAVGVSDVFRPRP